MWAVVLYSAFSFVISSLLSSKNFEISFTLERLLFGFLTLIEYLCFSYFLYLNIANKSLRKVISITSIAFTLFCIFYNIKPAYSRIDSVPIGVETIIILSFSFGFLYERMNDSKTLFIYNDYRFWIVLAFMFYLAGSFFIFIFANQIPESELHKYWIFTYVFYTIKNILFAIGMLIIGFQKPPNKHHVVQSSNPILKM